MFGKMKVLALTGALAAMTFAATGAQAAGWIAYPYDRLCQRIRGRRSTGAQ
jgi:hypothetical protein